MNESFSIIRSFSTGIFRAGGERITTAANEGLFVSSRRNGTWSTTRFALPSDMILDIAEGIIVNPPTAVMYYATIEGDLGRRLSVYNRFPEKGVPLAMTLTDKLIGGSSLACAPISNEFDGSDSEIVVGWRGALTPGDRQGGISVWTPLNKKGDQWRETNIDQGDISCEAVEVEDINRDQKIDIVALGGATRNLKIYYNNTEVTPRPKPSSLPPPPTRRKQ